MAKGRPLTMQVRKNILALLEENGQLTGYQVHKLYEKQFGQMTQRNIYYHLHKGVDLGLFAIKKVCVETGDYSWGSATQKIYYTKVE
ncbi:MAG: hypothetical protein ACMXYF_03630 [Candidatus Woesearchaeota archaeon]